MYLPLSQSYVAVAVAIPSDHVNLHEALTLAGWADVVGTKAKRALHYYSWISLAGYDGPRTVLCRPDGRAFRHHRAVSMFQTSEISHCLSDVQVR